MSRLYEFDTNDGLGPKLVRDGLTASEAGKLILDRENNEGLDVERWLFLLIQDGALYYYVSAPGGYGWEAAADQPGRAFADYDK